MIETYGKFTALDGTEFPYSDMRASRNEAAAKARQRDEIILAAREKRLGRNLTIRERLARATNDEMPPCEPVAEAEKEQPPKQAGITVPYPFTELASPLTPEEESAKKTFTEGWLAALDAEQAKKAEQGKQEQPPSLS